MIDKILIVLLLLFDLMMCILLCCYLQQKFVFVTLNDAIEILILLITSLPCLLMLFCAQTNHTNKKRKIKS